MALFISFSLIIITAYSTLILFFSFGWNRIPYFSPQKKCTQKATIICPVKNEIENLPYLLKSLKKQTYQNFELILVNDNSTDKSYFFLQNIKLDNFSFDIKILNNKGEGKKTAIKTAIESTQNELIISLDADCLPSEKWLETIVAFYEERQSDLIVCPVVINERKSFLSKFQRLEFVSLVGSGAGAIGIGRPILCNGANLAFKKTEWVKSEKDLYFNEKSGDDIYLLQSIRKRKGKIDFLKNKNTTVITKSKKNLKEFLKQHIRWASKTSALKNKDYLLTSIIVFSASLLLVMTLFLFLCFNISFLITFLLSFILKYVVDTLFFLQLKSFFDLKNIALQSLIFSFFYPFYVVITALFSFSKIKQQRQKRNSIFSIT